MKRNSPLAKLSPPRLTKVYPRRRLFKCLDQARKCPVVWVCAPAGAGKTTLVANYLKDRGLRCLWYQVDAGDNDPASFFYYLGQAAPRRRQPMSLFTPAYLPNLTVFTRNFFRELFTRLNTPAVLVFDNYQEMSEQSPLHEALAQGLREAPVGITTLIISRSDPPASFASLRAINALAVVPWEELRLNEAESEGVARLHNADFSATTLRTLIEQSQGWMAGLVLLLEQRRTSPHQQIGNEMRDHALLFDYFATELFEHAEPATQELLLKTAFLPKITLSAATELSGNPKAETILNDLARRNYFTLRHAEGSYAYHPLFLDFLRDRAARTFAPNTLHTLRTYSAALLRAQGDIESAVRLLHAEQDWSALVPLVLQEAPQLAATGRFATIEAAILPLPETMLVQVPWLRYWLGVCRMLVNPTDAIPLLEAAYTQFDRTGDILGRYLAWAGAVDAISFAMQDYSQFDLWLERLDHLTETHPEFPSVEVEARVVASALTAINWRQPTHPAASRLQARALDLLQRCTDVPVTARLGFHLFLYKYWYDTNHAEIGRILDRFAQLDKHLERFPFERILTRHVRIMHHASECAPGPALVILEEALEIAERSGIHVLDCVLLSLGVYACLVSGDLEKGSELLQRLEETVQRTGSKFDHSLRQRMRSWRHALLGDFPAALREIELAIRINREIGAMLLNKGAYQSLALYQIASGDADAARATLADIEALPGFENDANVGHSSFDKLLVIGHMALASGNEAGACAAVAQLMRLARRSSYVTAIGTLPTMLAQTCAFAIEHDIDADTARAIIQRRQLPPPMDSHSMEQWPYPVKLYTLGRFEIVIDGKPLRFTGKAQKKPLELLMVLVSALVSAGNQGISEARISETLWGKETTHSAPTSFAMTLHRLRKLLGDENVVLFSNNCLSLNPQKVWVDTLAFESLLNRTETATATDSDADVRRILALYQGSFLSDTELACALTPREKLRARFLRFVDQASQRCIQNGRFDEALRLIDKGLEAEPLAEEFYFQRMRCQAALGQRAEALTTYRRCQNMLSILLSIEPSEKTQAFYRALLHDQPLP